MIPRLISGCENRAVSLADAEVAGQGEFVPAAEAKAVDHGDNRFRESIDRVEKRLFVKQVALRYRRLAGEFADVGSGDKGFLARSR